MVILGIDPGIAITGYGAIKKLTGANFECLGYGSILTSPKLHAGKRLEKLNAELNKIIEKYSPDALIVESIFFFKNLKTAMPVSQAKGVILFTAAKKKIPVLEFTPLQMKMTIAGYGRAEKKQIQKMIKMTLNLAEMPKPDDAADALGIAICGALKLSSEKRFS